MKKTILSLFFLLTILSTYGQEKSAWKQVEKALNFSQEKLRRSSLPTDYKLYEFDYKSFEKQLNNVPKRDSFFGKSDVIVSIPTDKGTLEEYRIVEASTFEESLQAQFPEIRSFAGQGVKDPSKIIRFSLSPYNGLSAIIRSGSEQTTFIIDPISMDYKTVIVFDRAKSTKAAGNFICTTEEAVKEFGPEINRGVNEILNNADDATLRRFRMAQSCTGEYANYFGATSPAQVALVMAAFNATYTRVNGIFEMDFNATMVLVAQTTNVIYYNPATDPYSPSANMANWNVELQNNLSSNLTGPATPLAANNAAYDIGHLFGADGGGGNAGCIGCICTNDTASTTDKNKGAGITSPADAIPQGDNFDVDYVAHEIGHQLGGNHTFSFSAENNAVNMEPGSGVTIMGYAGITGATDVAAHSIAIFHAGSIQQVTNNIKGKTCQTNIAIANAVPVPSAVATKTLPIGTAFKLVGTATDANAGDVLTYCWEQVDDATTVGAAASYPSGTKTNGANFRSYMPELNGTRYFPRLQDHVANGVAGNMWEIVPTIARTLNFRMTVRDNRPGGGNNESVNTAVTFDATKGPFTVTSQATAGINYPQASTQTVTWTVNNTNTMTGAANVNIKLSTDGGVTFPITLLANTPNDGTQTVTIPNVFAPYCRILIEPTANDFYAINTVNFAIGYAVSQVCNSYTGTPTTGTIPQGSYTGWSINIPDSFTISDANITTAITHDRRNQVYAFVRSPQSIDVDLFQGGSCGILIKNLNGTFDDESANAAGCGTTDNFGNMRPLASLTGFDGLNSAGTWIFAAADAVNDARTGTVNSFTIQLCYNSVIETPIACGTISTTWNGSSWSNGAPLRNVAVTFTGNYTSTADLEACSVTVNNGANVVFNAGHTLIVGGSVTVNTGGSLTINNNAALRQIDNAAVNTGNIIVRRNSQPMIRQDYTAWSSPVVGQQLLAFSPNTVATRFYQYLYTGTTTPTAYQSVTPTTNFLAGKGYMIRVDNTWSSTVASSYNGQFTGVPTNGVVNQSIGTGYNLLGNPYASPIDADTFLADNASIGTLYFWTNTTAASGGVYPQNNFAAYTTLGGTAAFGSAVIPNGTIQTGQGFYVQASAADAIDFNNAQRVNASTSTQFFRTSNQVNATVSAEKHRIWFNLNDANTSYNQMLLGYMQGATNGFDNMIDGKVLDDTKPTLFNVINADKYVIQGRSLPFTDADVVPLGLKVVTPGTYSISIENVDGLFTSQDVFIKDKYNNSIHDVKQTPYSFSTQDGTFTDRFEVVYKNTLTNEDFVNENGITVYSNQNGIVISAIENIKEITVFDILGRKLYHNEKVNEKEFVVAKLTQSNQALLVKTTLTNGQSITKKVVF